MTETLERPVVDEHELQHLDFEISCNFRDCEHAADWWLVCLACGAHTPICEPHRRRELLEIETTPGLLVACHDCQQTVPGPMWRRLFAYVPIGRT